jgi:large subunit ribosomal protein L18
MKHNRKIQKQKRHVRVRAKITGTADRPRMSVYRSNKGLFVQLIDDTSGKTLVGIRSDKRNTKSAHDLGLEIAEKAKEKHIATIVFDRGGYMYHGSIKALADAAREGGLRF